MLWNGNEDMEMQLKLQNSRKQLEQIISTSTISKVSLS